VVPAEVPVEAVELRGVGWAREQQGPDRGVLPDPPPAVAQGGLDGRAGPRDPPLDLGDPGGELPERGQEGLRGAGCSTGENRAGRSGGNGGGPSSVIRVARRESFGPSRNGFLRSGDGWPVGGSAVTDAEVRQALREVVDPELGLNIVDLGLVYTVDVQGDRVYVAMTMTGYSGRRMPLALAMGIRRPRQLVEANRCLP
jgi:hypothetical protein